MGKAAKWLRGLFRGGKSSPVPSENTCPPKEKKRWGFAWSLGDKDGGTVAHWSQEAAAVAALKVPRSPAPIVAGSSCPPSLAPGGRDGGEQKKRAIAVAAATAAVAEAAVVAAQAAAAVVRLTSSGRSYGSGRKYEEWAVVKIQAVFRGYLARRALKALKGLVKLQALVRGHIVRKQAAQTWRCMQALVRAQARARACRVLPENSQHKKLFWPPHAGPLTPEKYKVTTCKSGAKLDRTGTLKKNASNRRNTDVINSETMRSGWNWLDQLMEHRNEDRQGATTRTEVVTNDEKNDKILEIDTGKPQSNSKRRNTKLSSCSPLASSDQNSWSFATMPDSPSKDSTTAQFSTPSPSTVDMQLPLSPLRFTREAEVLYESPQFFSSSRPGSTKRGAFTPAKSECSESLFSAYSEYPSYMANTESSWAKVRSHSAPRQRPEFLERLPAQGLCAGGHIVQLSSSSSQRLSSTAFTHLKFTTKAYPGSGRLDRLGMPIGALAGNDL